MEKSPLPLSAGDLPQQHLLGTPLCCTTYADLAAHCWRLAREPHPSVVDFANTQIVTMRRHEPWFREASRCVDYLNPDGMPLIWCLNLHGAGLRDRVYGPTFMRAFLNGAPAGSTHYLLGGSEECGRRLRENFTRANPGLRFVGSFHGKCLPDGTLEGDAETQVIEDLNRLAPDCIWIGLGTPKQYTWTQRHKALLRRGVLLTVGFAFEVNAGIKPDAPPWMQRAGLTWVFRLCSEPRRLVTRYLRYNSLFLFYLLWDGVRGRAFARPQQSHGPT